LPTPPNRADTFAYGDFEIDPEHGVLRCGYRLDDVDFEERITIGPGWRWDPAAVEAARLVHLLAGVSYYKAAAPGVIDVGRVGLRPGEREFLRAYYLDGLAEFAWRNALDLSDLRIEGGATAPPVVDAEVDPGRPLIPFGGGLDSIVTVELLRDLAPEAALFIVGGPDGPLDAIEAPASVSGFEVRRATRQLDPKILRSDHLGYLNGHVPVTGILSAIAVMAAVLSGRGAVVMSNEWSASSATLEVAGRVVNHQYSKSLDFEERFAAVIDRSFGGNVSYFSLLRPWSELWIARQFALLDRYHLAFRSCNRAFHIGREARLSRWCATCDKCCFIDLILSPFLAPSRLREIFAGHEPLDDPGLADRFRGLLGIGATAKPFECVGDVQECQAALVMAGERPDRSDCLLIGGLLAECEREGALSTDPVTPLLHPLGRHHIPDAFLRADLLV
jgi:hypothetical protein